MRQLFWRKQWQLRERRGGSDSEMRLLMMMIKGIFLCGKRGKFFPCRQRKNFSMKEGEKLIYTKADIFIKCGGG